MEGSVRQTDVGFKLGQLTTAVEGLGARLEDLDHKLFGNGREGVIDQHARELDLIKDVLLERKVKKQVLATIAHVIGGLLSWSWLQMVWPYLKHLLGL